MDAFLAADLLCALVYGVLALLLAAHSGRGKPAAWLTLACAATALWALAAGFEAQRGVARAASPAVLEALRAGAWLTFLIFAYRAGQAESRARGASRMLLGATAAVCAFLVLVAVRGEPESGLLVRTTLGARLLLALGGLALVEELLRGSWTQDRWRVRYLCVGVGGLLGYDLFLYSEALLFGRVAPLLDASRGAVNAIAAPLIAVAAARNPEWSAQLNVSRRAVQHSVVLVGAGIYLLVLAAAGALLRSIEADWGRLLQATFFFAALLLLAVLLFSTGMRVSLQQLLSRYLFTYRHDYREQWQRFSKAFSAPSRGRSLRERALQVVAGVVGSEKAGLWLLEAEVFACVAGFGLPSDAGDVPAEGRFAEQLRARRERVLQLDEQGDPEAAGLPEWLGAWREAWLLIPLLHQRELMGFIVVASPPVRRELHWEDRELLETVASQAASHLAEERTIRALEEARRFEELSRGLAFMAHDLRNLANELSLTLANARKHIHKPEFQRDMLLSMEESVAAMQRLLGRLRGRAQEARRALPTDLTRLLGGWLRRRFSGSSLVSLELDTGSPLPVDADGDRLVAVSSHLIQNAIEAVADDGHVTVRLRRDGDMSLLEVVDDGSGMSPAFVRERLHRPFGSSKQDGMGLGLYECRRIALELGGDLAIESEPGRGTVARLRLPLAGRQAGKDAGAAS